MKHGTLQWPGVGHLSPSGGGSRNPFGMDFKIAAYTWTKFLCEKDSDGDGQSNGVELGDPDCTWIMGNSNTDGLRTTCITHPGMATSPNDLEGLDGCDFWYSDAAQPEPELPSAPSSVIVGDNDDAEGEYNKNMTNVEDLVIDADEEPNADSPQMAMYNPWEEQAFHDFRIKDFRLPRVTTTYVDFVFNLPHNMIEGDGVHIVFGEALVNQKDHLHHFVVTGCTEQFPDNMTRVPLYGEDQERAGHACQTPLGGFSGWAPGATLWDSPPDVGVPVGGVSKIVAFHINAHYTDADRAPNEIIARDGIRVHYTTTLRSNVVISKNLINIGSSEVVTLPLGHKRLFLTRSCTVGSTLQDMPADAVSAFHHAHLLGREMYITLTKADGTVYDLNSQEKWNFDRQIMYPLHNVSIEAGDHVQSACVWDTTFVMRANGTIVDDEPVKLGLSTYDEMCINSLYVRVPRHEIQGMAYAEPFECVEDEKNVIWMGELSQDDNIIANANEVWEKHNPDFARNENMLYASTQHGEALPALPLDDAFSSCQRCHNENQHKVWGVHCWVSSEHAAKGDTNGALLAQSPSFQCPESASFRTEYTCGQAFEYSIGKNHQHSPECSAYRAYCCGEAPLCGAGTSWNPSHGMCEADFAAIKDACRKGQEEFSFACANQKDVSCDEGHGDGLERASEQECFDCRFCFDCGRYGTCNLSVEEKCWGEGTYPRCSVEHHQCTWYDYESLR